MLTTSQIKDVSPVVHPDRTLKESSPILALEGRLVVSTRLVDLVRSFSCSFNLKEVDHSCTHSNGNGRKHEATRKTLRAV
jgi:hypothetical protein